MKKTAFRVFGVLFIMYSCSNNSNSVYPEISDITESVYTSVTIQPDSLYQAHAAINGIIETNLVEEGDRVTRGQPMIQVINTNPRLNTENARLSLEQARKNYDGNTAILNSIEDEIRSAELQLENDSINYCRQKNLWDQQIGSKVEYDSKKLAYELSQNSLEMLKDRYDRTREELETQLRQAQNNYRTSLTTTEDFTISSKINGKVYTLYKNPGEVVSTMEPLAAVGSDSVFILEMLVDEVDIVKIRPGQLVLITLDAYNDEVFEARVDKIIPKKDQRNQTFVVEALFEDAPEVLYPGLSGEGNVLIARRDGVLTIPKDYLMENNTVKTADGIVPVEIGLQSLDRVEILSGITSETRILKPEQ